MDNVQKAKQHVGAIFGVLAFDTETRWNELVRGGWECRTGLCNGHLCGYVGETGEYRVWLEPSGDLPYIRCKHTLVSGCYEPTRMAMGMTGDAEAKVVPHD